MIDTDPSDARFFDIVPPRDVPAASAPAPTVA